ncbi:MAG: hypothetical protein K8T25_17150 [Planctomycetia bacterium]|nr:hypothetical protein [Planctomycetia bacterium]
MPSSIHHFHSTQTLKHRKKALAIAYLLFVPFWSARAEEPRVEPTAKAAERAALLKAAIKTFSLSVSNFPSSRSEDFDSLTLKVGAKSDRRERRANERYVEISEAQAEKIVDYLATSGYLEHAKNVLPPPVHSINCYELHILASDQGKSISFKNILGWGLRLKQNLNGLRRELDGEAATEMDKLISSLDKKH